MSDTKAEAKPPTIDKLYVDQVKFYLDKLQGIPKMMEELEGLTKQAREQAQEEVAGFALSLRMNKIDADALEAFFKHPYPKMEPARDAHGRLLPETWRLVVPRFIPLNIGYLESQDEGWNYFRVNRYMDWFGEIPDFIKKQIGWKEAPDLKIAGEELVGAPEAVKEAVKKYKGLVTEKDGKVLINKNRAYELIVQLLKDGVKPFLQRPVQDEDRVNRRCDFTPRDYQKEILNTFYKYSSIGVFIPPSTGKTILGLLALTSIKGPHLVVVPTVTLVEQWEDHIQAETDLKLGEDVIVCTYQTAISKQSAKKWKLIIFDEVHHMPAKTFIKLSLLQRDYSLGLSATPYREDEGGEELIFALTGQPTGLAWQYFKELKIIKNPVCHVWIEKNVDAKMKRLDELMQEKRKTIIFSDSLELGERVAKRYAIPFVSGASEERLKTLKDNQATVISRVGDEGVSLPDIERVIEISWLFGCYDEQTEVLTLDGWKPFANTSETDMFATRRQDGVIEYHRATERQQYRYDGPMVHITGRSYDLLVTPEHRTLVRGYGKECVMRADEVIRQPRGKVELIRDAKWVGDDADTFSLPPVGPTPYVAKQRELYQRAVLLDEAGRSRRQIASQIGVGYFTVNYWLRERADPINRQSRTRNIASFPTNAFLTMLGWYIAEGSIDHGRGVKISQSKSEAYIGEIERSIEALGFEPHRIEDGVKFYSKQVAQYLGPLGHSWEKRIPRDVLRLPPDKLRILLEAMLKGDGNGRNVYWTSSKQLADDVQELCLRCGLAASIGIHLRRGNPGQIRGRTVKSNRLQYAVSISYNHLTPQIWTKPRIESYSGFVYDVTVPNHTLFVRRNGRAVWCGNSRRQELQRFTRLLHGRDYAGEGEAHVLMTMEEYVHDKKRLFSIMDRAFKVVLHREGISDKVIEQSTRTIPAPRPIRERAAPQGPMNQIPVATPEIPAAVMQRLPGITRTLERLSSVEKAVAVTMLGNPSNSYSTKELSLATGYSIKTLSNMAHYGKLIDQGLIKKEGEKYRSAI